MVIELLKESEAMLEGHFLLSSGRHSGQYFQCAKLLQYPDKAEEVLRTVTEQIKGLDIDIVVGPAMGGIIVAYELGKQLHKPAIFTERVDGKMTLRRGFEITKGMKVIITEDVVTTGKSSMEAAEVIQEAGGEIVGIACIVDRQGSNLKYPIYSALKMKTESFERETCPFCKKNIPYIKPGSRNIL